MSELHAPNPRQKYAVQHDNGHEELTHVSPLAREFTERIFGGAKLAIGSIYLWVLDGKTDSSRIPVEVISGQYWGEYGLSNFWYWQELSSDGVTSGKQHSGYDNVEGAFQGPISRDDAVKFFANKNG